MRSVRLARSIGPAVAVLALLGAGCSTTVTGTPASSSGFPTGGTAIAEAEAQARGEQSADAVDACALIPSAEVDELIGANPGPQPVAVGGDGGSCTWENPVDYFSVTVNIGQSGTAANGELPAWDPILGEEKPLPDGMRGLGGGAVEFVAGDRHCDVQVVTVAIGDRDGDEAQAVAFAKAIREKL